MKINEPSEIQDSKDKLEEQGYQIRSFGNICNLWKEKKIKLIDEKQGEITK